MTLHLVCPHCNTTNRVAKTALDTAAEINCGKCHTPMFDKTPAPLNAAGLAAQIQKSDIPVMVDFWAPWCGPCLSMAPEFQKACAQMEPKVRFVKVDTQAHQDVAMQFNIRSIPTLAIFKGGKEVARESGARAAPDLMRWANHYL